MDNFSFLLIVGISWLILNVLTKSNWFEVDNPEIGWFYLLFRTKKLNNLIDRLANKGRFLWGFIWDVGIVAGIGVMAIGLFMFAISLPQFFIPSETGSTTPALAVVPIIPGVTISLESLPYFIIAIMIGAIFHELAHGVSARFEDIDLKSTGIFVFFLLFGAFVEPDEKSLEKKSRRAKLRVYSAGALANFVVGIIFLGILFSLPLVIGPMFSSSNGVLIVEVNGEPALSSGFEVGDVIIGINTSSTYTNLTSMNDLLSYTNSSFLPHQNYTFHFSNKDTITIETIENPDNSSRGSIGGLRITNNYKENQPFIYNTVLYTFLINLMLGLMNLLPIPVADGDKIIYTLLGPERTRLYSFIKIFTLSIIGLNFLLTFIFVGWQPL